MKKMLLISIAIFSLFIIPIADAAVGVSTPVPSSIELLKGESGRFKFQIQLSPEEPESMFCDYSFENVSDLRIEFDSTGPFEVNPGTGTVVLGTVTAPESAAAGKHTEKFCISCKKSTSAEGAVVYGVFCTPEINVEVVDIRTKENMQIPPKPQPDITAYYTIGIIAAAALMLLFVLLLMWKKHKKKTGDLQ